MAHVELPQEEFQPLIQSMKRVFAPFMDAIPSIIRIPDEVKRLTESISTDINSGNEDRLDTASEKLVDPMIQGLRNFFDKQDADRKAELDKIAAQREAANAEVQKLQDLGVPAEVTKQNTVNILNEKEILEKQKEYIKEQKEVSFLESEIADEKSKGEGADSERLLMLKEALDKQNQLVEEQGKVLGDRLPRQKVKENVGARDFIPAPLMEAYDNIAETAMESGRALGSIFQPLIGLKKLFAEKEEYEEDEFEDREKKDKKQGKAMVLTTLKFLALAATLAVFAKGIYDLGKMFGFFKEKPGKDEQQPGETTLDYRDRVDTMSDKSEAQKQKLKTQSMDPVARFIYTSSIGNEQKDMEAAAQRDENLRAKQMRENYTKEHAEFLKQEAKKEKENQEQSTNIFTNNVANNSNVATVASVDKSASRENAITSGGVA